MKTAELIEKAETRASAFSVDKGYYLFNKSELSELLKQHVIEFTLNQSPRTPIIIDGEKKVRERIEKLYNEWIIK